MLKYGLEIPAQERCAVELEDTSWDRKGQCASEIEYTEMGDYLVGHGCKTAFVIVVS